MLLVRLSFLLSSTSTVLMYLSLQILFYSSFCLLVEGQLLVLLLQSSKVADYTFLYQQLTFRLQPSVPPEDASLGNPHDGRCGMNSLHVAFPFPCVVSLRAKDSVFTETPFRYSFPLTGKAHLPVVIKILRKAAMPSELKHQSVDDRHRSYSYPVESRETGLESVLSFSYKLSAKTKNVCPTFKIFRFDIRVFLLLDKLPYQTNELYYP